MVCPLVAVIQWQSEIARFTPPGSVKVPAISRRLVSRRATVSLADTASLADIALPSQYVVICIAWGGSQVAGLSCPIDVPDAGMHLRQSCGTACFFKFESACTL